MLRLKVQSIRSILWVGNLLVIVAIAALLAKIYMGSRAKGSAKLFAYLDPQKIEEQWKDVSANSGGSAGQTAQHWKLYRTTYDLNVTGKEPPPAPDVVNPNESEAPPMKPITDVIRVDLVSFLWDDAVENHARIRYLEDGPLGVKPTAGAPTRAAMGGVRAREEAKVSADFMIVGDELRAPWNAAPFFGKLARVTKDGVAFSWGGEDVLLRTGEFDRIESMAEPKLMPGLDDPGLSDDEIARRIAEAKVSRQVGEHGWFIGTDELATLDEQHETLMAEIGVGMTFSRKEKRPLLQLNKIPEGSLAAERGFEEGDIILSINDEPISSKYAAIQYFKQHPGHAKFNVEIERRGTRITKAFEAAR